MTRHRPSDDFREEIESHLALEADRLAAERRLDEDEARAAARREFGNVTSAEERYYESSRWMWLDTLRRNVGYAIRTMAHHPAFSIGTIVTLGFGIGINVALFSIFSGMVLRPFPVPDASRVVNVYQDLRGPVTRSVSGMLSLVSYAEYQEFREVGRSFSSLAVYSNREVTTPLKETGAFRADLVSCNYFSTLAIHIPVGRAFSADECAYVGSTAVAVLSDATWRQLYGADPRIIGRTISLNRHPFTVIGVAEPGFAGIGLLPAEAWVPVTMQATLQHGGDSLIVRDWSWLFMVGRLKAGATTEQARAELSTVAARRDAANPGRQARIVVSRGAFFNFPEAKYFGLAAVAAIGVLGFIVIAMASANIMNLLLARGVARRREIGIRLAVGASRWALVLQLLTESLLLSVIGGALGFAIAFLLPVALRTVVPVALQLDLSPDWRVLLFATAASVATALTFGLLPALHATQVDLVSAFKGMVAVGRRSIDASRLRNSIVGIQVGGSAFLLVIAGLFLRGADRAANADPGYVTTNVTRFSLNLRELGYEPARAREIAERLAQRIREVPAVRDVSFAESLPLLGRHGESFTVVDPEPDGPRDINLSLNIVEPAFFSALSIPLVDGRIFSEQEVRSGESFAVVSRSFADAVFPKTGAVGRRFRSTGPLGIRTYTITGVAADNRIYSLTDEREQFVYLSAQPAERGRLDIVVRTSGDPAELERNVPAWAREIDAEVRIQAERFSDRFNNAVKPARIASTLAGTMGLLTMVLAVVGVYGVVSYAVSQRSREVAVRLALGATSRGVIGLVMRQGRIPVLAGAVTGIVLAAGATQLIRKLLFGVSPLDPLSYLLAAVVLVSASMLAMYLPARRVASVDPAGTLRQE